MESEREVDLLKTQVVRELKKGSSRRSSAIAPTSFVSSKIKVRESPIHAHGMFASAAIRQGEVVFIKGGHILERHHLFSSEKIGSYLPIDDGYYIGARNATEERGIKLYINHSCEPNCGIRGEITFISLRSINPNEELTIDYAMVDDDDYDFQCSCGANSCRLRITGQDWRIPALQRKYRRHFSRYLADKMLTRTAG